MTKSIARPGSWWVAAATALAWLGFFIHNIADLPGQSLLSPETGLPTLVYLVLWLAWWRFPGQRLTLWMLLGWGLVSLIGGGLSVLPFPFLPFYPEQSLRHYVFHVVYGAAQLPLIVVTAALLRAAAGSISSFEEAE
ncbi:MAG TPA: hypothetical protein PLO33_03215 [Kouleothrix sp.]|uniref:hypothetical protein n=1 Tax=Kouleothrix sp. TaxID=2779161 RepID=UPI002B9ACD5C|nr:hypothetical protein [Kouleothrix sp.]HRC74659.1 hypothetical protein [Kouleothrix sp.]